MCKYVILLLGVLGSLPLAGAQTPALPQIRVVLAGDSTVAPKSGWGTAFGALLKPEAECQNLALGGRSSKSFRNEGHWQKVLALKPDWVLIQFGHNDMPGKGPERETDPQTTYPEFMGRYVDEARAIGAKPILVTSVTRRNFDAQGRIQDTLLPYAEAVKKLAAEKNVALVDLHARSIEQVEKMGPKAAAILDAPSKNPKQPDHTHFSRKGGELTARLVADELRRAAPELAKYLK